MTFAMIALFVAGVLAFYVYFVEEDEFDPTPAGDGSEPDRPDYDDINHEPKPIPSNEPVS